MDLTTIYCPECGDEAEDTPPENYITAGVVPEYSHVSDRTALCPVATYLGDRPAYPIEHQVSA